MFLLLHVYPIVLSFVLSSSRVSQRYARFVSRSNRKPIPFVYANATCTRILTCNVVWCVVFCGRCKCAVKIAMAAPVASREGWNIFTDVSVK